MSDLFIVRLIESNISLPEATYAKLVNLPADRTAKLWPTAPRQESIQISYCSPAGKVGEFYRVRLLGKANGFQLEKPIRYLQPPHSGVRAYLPRVAKLDWLKTLASPEQPLIITEGEFKALSACLHGFPTIGLGGVENWRSAREGKQLIDELAAANWQDRRVYICYDSDVATKPQVAVAARRLAEELATLGAVVYDAGLPASTGTKIGLDDFLVQQGVTALRNHLRDAPPFTSVRVLHEFNQRFVFIRVTSTVFEAEHRVAYESSRFVNAIEANARYAVSTMTAQGTKLVMKQTAAEWLKWPNRRAVQRPDYCPGNPNLIVTHKGAVTLNLWHGWGVAPKRGDRALWDELFEYLMDREGPDTRRWFEQWLAYPLQHPGAKLYTAVAMWGATQGTGKTLLGETMIRIYGENGQRVGVRELEGAFNGWAQRKQFVLGDEITGSDHRGHADELKGLITGDVIRVNEKFERAYDLPNTINFYFTSNHADSFFLDGKDRRMAVFETPKATKPLAFYKKYNDWMKSEEGPAALFYYLLNVDTSDFNPSAPAPMTLSKEIMIEQSSSDVGRFVTMVLLDPEQAERVYGVPASVELFTVDDLFKFYDPRKEKRATVKAVSLELQKQNATKVLKGKQVRIDGLGQVRIYAVRDHARWSRATKELVINTMKSRVIPTAKY
jgi:hypothetical protein